MTNLIDPALLFSPEIRAAFPPTARRMILRPIIDYINMLFNNANNQTFLDNSYEQTFNHNILSLQQQIDASTARLSALEAALNVPQADAITSLPESPVTISAANLLNIGLLGGNENEDRRTINKILTLLRTHGWIKK